jgi:hypothetical protein
MFLSIILIFFVVSTVADNELINLTRQNNRSKRHASSDHMLTFHSDVDMIVQNASQFYMVNKLKLPSKMDFSCKSKFLPIKVELKNEDYVVYLESGKDQQVVKWLRIEQEDGETCQKIKHYALDNQQDVVIVNRHLDLVEKKNVHRTVVYNLFKDYEFWTLFLYQMGLYDAETDRMKYFLSVQVS